MPTPEATVAKRMTTMTMMERRRSLKRRDWIGMSLRRELRQRTRGSSSTTMCPAAGRGEGMTTRTSRRTKGQPSPPPRRSERPRPEQPQPEQALPPAAELERLLLPIQRGDGSMESRPPVPCLVFVLCVARRCKDISSIFVGVKRKYSFSQSQRCGGCVF